LAAAIGLGEAMGGTALAAPNPAGHGTPGTTIATTGTWQKLRDMTIYGNYAGYAIIGPLTKASFQGFAGGPSFSDDGRYVYVPTQEGDCGIIRIDTQSGQSTVLSYACNNQVYTNPRKSAQFNGYVAVNNSEVGQAQVLNGATMAMANANWPKSFNGVSQSVQIDSGYVYLAHDGQPGTLTATNIQSGATATFQAAARWNGVYSMEIDRTNKLLVCCDNGTGNLYLFNLSAVAGGAAPALLATIPTQHLGVSNGNRLYAGSGNMIRTYDITTPTAPRPIGGTAVYQSAHAAMYGNLKLDRVNNLLYATWGDTNQSGTDVLAIGTADALRLITTIPGWTQSGPGATVSCPAVDTALSSAGTKFALSSEAGPGGSIIYDVSKVAGGGPAVVLQTCYANAETRQSTTVAGDSAEYVYSSCRFSYAVHDPKDTLIFTGTVGTIIGSRLQSFGTTAGGTDTTLRIAPGAVGGGYDYLFRCHNGTMTPLVCYGDATLVNTAWDGKYLTAVVNASGWFKIVTYSVGPGPSYALTPVATYAGPFGTQQTTGLFVDGTCGVPGSTLWVSDSALGVMTFDVGHLGIIAPIVTEDIPDRLVTFVQAAPTLSAATGGQVQLGWTYRVLAAYFDAFGVCCGITNLSNGVPLATPNNALRISALPAPPPLAVTFCLYGQAQWTASGPNAPIGGPSSITGAQGLPVSTASVLVTSNNNTWFGSAPNVSPGSFIPAAGGICEIRKASGRIYVSQGDLGIRVYNPSTMKRTGQITATGDTNQANNPLAAPGIDVYTDGAGRQWLMAPNYTASGGHNGCVALNTTANPDNPPATFIPTTVAGFTCRTYRTGSTDKGVLMATLAGAVGFQCT